MSRSYEMQYELTGCDASRQKEIKEFLDCDWGVCEYETNKNGKEYFMPEAESISIGGGASERDYFEEFRNGVWKANGGYCRVWMKLVYLDDPPTDEFETYEDDYDDFKETS